MNLKQLIYKRLVHAKDIGGLLAKYAGHPAVFDTEAPDDKQDGWEGKTQYPRLNIVLDMQANEERSSVGSLTITIYTERTSMVILEIESLVKTCFRDLLISPEDGGPYSFAWARTDPFSIEGTNVIGQDVTFDIMEYSAQETTDPDPIVALSRYIKKLYPDSIVLGVDPVGEFTEASVTPIFYSRLAWILRKLLCTCSSLLSLTVSSMRDSSDLPLLLRKIRFLWMTEWITPPDSTVKRCTTLSMRL